ncbi:hypothetical protein NP493_432g01037 [Ridgeia piscesae]|uniref:Midnolin n=1 Tax=Ridgeia piscesae TaxID=27915 RepID=A0AAD9L0B4_RIDPI|nr:hypothetical protein NP493_432g01037 [Ridgeia piscesae]
MRLGEHMMFVQLQLSTSPPSVKHTHHPPHRCLRKSAPYPQHVPSTSTTTSSSSSSSTAHGAFSRTAAMAADHSRKADDARTSGPRTGGATLSEAKQNLSQKLQEFSQVARTQGDETADTPAQRPSSSSSSPSSSSSSSSPYSSHAIIESMEQVGQGVYSGTFSGTLNPALQDHDGRPKRSINTIIHILNDLLGASPEYRAHRRARRIHRQEASHFSKPADCQRQSEENQATRGKMEYLQMMLQERRNRRQARKERRSCPYPAINPHPVLVGSSSQGGSTSFGFDTNVDSGAASGYAQMMQENEAELTQGAVVV